MKFIKGCDRNQTSLIPKTLDESIHENNDVRLIDLYIDSLDLNEFGFKTDFSEVGRPGYHPSDLLKLFIYGYLNKMRSSRVLEKECGRNIELIWLVKGLMPDHNTISNFRRDNGRGIKKVFRNSVEIATSFSLIGGILLAVDGSKFRAQNSKKNNFTKEKTERHIKYLERKLEEYNNLLSSEDDVDGEAHDENASKTETMIESKEKIEQKKSDCGQRLKKYQKMQADLEQSGESQVSLSDPDSRLLASSNKQAEVGYNVQLSVDAKYKLAVDFKVTSENDNKAMGEMGRRLKAILGHSKFTVLLDKGYHTGSEFKYVERFDINVIVGSPLASSHAPDPAYDVSQFIYNEAEDQYTCPAENILTTNGKEYTKTKRKTKYKIKKYDTKACKTCPFLTNCSKRKSGKVIERSEFMDQIEANSKRLEQNKELYKQRQAIVEHPFGTIKRQWGFDHIITKKTTQRAESDMGLIFAAYNLRRLINILGFDLFKAFLTGALSMENIFSTYRSYFKPLRVTLKIYRGKSQSQVSKVKMSYNRLIELRAA